MTKKLIFIAEDNETLRYGYLRILGISKKYEVQAFETATALLSALEGGASPDLILTDNEMPGMTGTELVAYLRNTGFEKPIIMVSGDNRVQSNKVLQAQLQNFLAKPAPIGELVEAIDIAIAS